MFGEEHVRRYRETNGEVGHIWHGSKVLLLTTKSRNTGEPRTTPLAYDRVRDNFVVLASNGDALLAPCGSSSHRCGEMVRPRQALGQADRA